MEHQRKQNGFFSIVLTFSLFIVALIIFPIGRLFPSTSLWIPICLYSILDIGFIIALFMGIKSKSISRTVKIFIFIFNIILIVSVTIFVFLLLVATGIAGA